MSACTWRNECAYTAYATSVAKCQRDVHNVAPPPRMDLHRVGKIVAEPNTCSVAKLLNAPTHSAYRVARSVIDAHWHHVRNIDTSVHRGRRADARLAGGGGVEVGGVGRHSPNYSAAVS